jgi:hypothetical protein
MPAKPSEPHVTSLELFFDLVLVFAITQVTTFWSDHLTWLGRSHGRDAGGLVAVPRAFDDSALLFACAFTEARAAQGVTDFGAVPREVAVWLTTRA